MSLVKLDTQTNSDQVTIPIDPPRPSTDTESCDQVFTDLGVVVKERCVGHDLNANQIKIIDGDTSTAIGDDCHRCGRPLKRSKPNSMPTSTHLQHRSAGATVATNANQRTQQLLLKTRPAQVARNTLRIAASVSTPSNQMTPRTNRHMTDTPNLGTSAPTLRTHAIGGTTDE